MQILNIEELLLESGERLHNVELAYQTYGNLNENKSNVIWVFHAISGNTKVIEWWDGIFGEGKLYDPQEQFIICANCIGSPFGSTKPDSLKFPQITVRDQVNAYLHLAQVLSINNIHTVIGGSFGGYQALEFAYSYKGSISHLVLLASSAKESAWGIAIHEAQRMALKADPSFGTLGGGNEGLKAARALAMLTYRTSDKLITDQTDTGQQLDDFKASSYLNYQGNKFSKNFNALSLYYLTKCIDSHNIGRGRGGTSTALQKIHIPTLVIGFISDLLVPINSQRYLAKHIPNTSLEELSSNYGHDGFLMEHESITKCIKQFYRKEKTTCRRAVLKFGGSSLYGQSQLNKVIEIIKSESRKQSIALVISARGNTTDQLINLYRLASSGHDFQDQFDTFAAYSTNDIAGIDISYELDALKNTLSAIKLLKLKSTQARDKVLVYGELISVKVISIILKQNNYKCKIIDARDCINCEVTEMNIKVDLQKSKKSTLEIFKSIKSDVIPIITGFIASDQNGNDITLGRNGSNYSASLFAQFIQASVVQNWTDVEGIYSADPRKVANAIQIKRMNYQEANELACFGMNLLHPKTILPLKNANIPLHIRSTKHLNHQGTIIDNVGDLIGIKAVTSVDNVSLISIAGSQLKDNIGIDARIFSCLQQKSINVKMISQASTENGIGFVVDSNQAKLAEQSLRIEFEKELSLNHIHEISSKYDISIIAIIGKHNYSLEKAIKTLRNNGIWMHLINNSISGKNITLVIDRKHLSKALNLVHNEVYGTIKTINVFSIGKGNVGAEFINQILSRPNIEEKRAHLKLIGICDSKKYILNSNGINADWEIALTNGKEYDTLTHIINELKEQYLNNIVIVDNTASEEVSEYYEQFVKNNFDIVASNKVFNSGDLIRHKKLKKALRTKGKKFFYETNVGAGLPVIELVKSLHQSSDKVRKIRGIFSGSLSYIFNNFSESDKPISYFIDQAVDKGFAEPDPRSDLSGLDVGRKLVIVARELGLDISLEQVEINNLIPESLQNCQSLDEFKRKQKLLNDNYQKLKENMKKDQALRYIGEIDVLENKLTAKLVITEPTDPISSITNSDNYFELYTDSYNENPIVLQGRGAGRIVTAKGVYSDVIKLI
jgi:homoserine O-acetyltransferase